MRKISVHMRRAFSAAVIFPAVVLAGPAFAEKGARRDLTVEQAPIANCGVGPGYSASKIQVAATLDHADGIYSVGDAVVLQVRASEDVYITVLEVGSSGKVHIIFPNQFQRNNRIRANEAVRIPTDDSSFRIRVGGPAGRDVIKVFATREPLDTLAQQRLTSEGPYYTTNRNARSLARDLSVELREKHKNEFGTAIQIFKIVAPNGSPGASVAVDESGGRPGGDASVSAAPDGAATVQAGAGGAGGGGAGPGTRGGDGGKGGDAILCKGCVVIPK
jgi:hypothetical protein